MVRFLHTADWQIGMTRRYLGVEAQARYAQDRTDAIARLGAAARAEGCAFVVVAGDVFDSNLVATGTVRRALEAIAGIELPVLLLPGNHDPLDAASVYLSPTFRDNRPANVHVLAGEASRWRTDGVEVVGVPWTSRRPGYDLLSAALARLDAPAGLRVVVAHGRADSLGPTGDDPAAIHVGAVEAAFAADRLHYLALGDRHSTTALGRSGRAFYAGTPEPTDFDEVRPGRALVVDLAATGAVRTHEIVVGTWRWLAVDHTLTAGDDVGALLAELEAVGDKARTVVRLTLHGTLPLSLLSELDRRLVDLEDTFACVRRLDADLHLGEDLTGSDLTGFVAAAAAELRAAAGDDRTARDALLLLHRLHAGRGPQ